MRKVRALGPLLLLMASLLAASRAEASTTNTRARPLRGSKAPTSGSAQRYDPVLRLGGVQLDLEALRDEALEQLKGRITDAIEERADELTTAFDETADAHAQQIYNDFLYWLNEEVRAKLLRQYPHLKTEAAIEEKYVEWLESPDQELSLYVDLYLSERAPAIQWLLNAYRDEASWEIAGGLKEVYDDAQNKLQRFTQVVSDAEREPNAPTSDLLRKHGLSGDWVDTFEAHEDRFRTFDDGYKVVEATQILVSAFQTRVPREKIGHLTELLSLMGGTAEDSNIPVVSLFGQIVKAYGDVAREMLGQIDELSKQLRQRAGYCVGAGATGDDRHRAFVRQFGSRDQACPTRLKDVYERTLPADGRVYFFIGGRFLASREDNGEFPAVLQARKLIQAAVAQGDTTWQGRENDLATLAEVYNVAYSTEHGKGIAGLMREAAATMAGISRRQQELERGLSSPCSLTSLQRAIERETGLRSGDGVEPVADNEQRLAVRFAVGFIRGGGAYVTYSRIWSALRELSLLEVSGRVEATGGGACAGCAQAALQLILDRVQQIPGCEATHADRDGRFVIHALTRSPEFRIGLSASGGGQRSAVVSVNRVVAGVDRIPFVKELEGLRLELPVASAAASPSQASSGPTPRPSPASPGVDTSNPDGTAAGRPRVPSTPDPGAAAPVAPSPVAHTPSDSVPVVPARSVPDVVGLTPDVASQRIAAADLVAEFVGGDPAPSADSEFKVQAQQPDPGTLTAPGGRVRVRVHAGYDPRRTVPSVDGLAAAVADQRLKAAGFAVQITGGDPAPSSDRAFTVQDQRPAGGEAAGPGSTVVVRVYSNAVTHRVVPNVVGMAAAEAERRLGELGLVVVPQGGDPAPNQAAAFTVQSQQPGAGAAVANGTRVQLRIHSAFAAPAATPTPTAGVPRSAGVAIPPDADPNVFRCPSYGGRAPGPKPVSAQARWADCGHLFSPAYFHEGGGVWLHATWINPDDASPRGAEGCGRPPQFSFVPGRTQSEGATLNTPPHTTGTFWGSQRMASVSLSWGTKTSRPIPPALIELAHQMMVEAEWRARPCTGTTQSRPTPVATVPSPPVRPSPPISAPPADTRAQCTCTDSSGRHYRMAVFGQDCDPYGSDRDDNCRP